MKVMENANGVSKSCAQHRMSLPTGAKSPKGERVE